MNILDLIFPKACVSCGKSGSYICSPCQEKFERSSQKCPECRLISRFGKTHKSCASKYTLDGHFSIWKYKWPTRRVITSLKYRFASDIAEELSRMAIIELKRQSLGSKQAMLVPIPLHKRRQNWRGFNQAGVVGKSLAGSLNWTFEPKLLVRNIGGQAQVGLSQKERLQNISGKYAVNYEYLRPKHKKIVLFDDVYTTGATLKEAAKTLKKAGASTVWGLTLAG